MDTGIVANIAEDWHLYPNDKDAAAPKALS